MRLQTIVRRQDHSKRGYFRRIMGWSQLPAALSGTGPSYGIIGVRFTMNRLRFNTILFVYTFVSITGSLSAHAGETEPSFQLTAGFAKSEITPEAGTPLGGYGKNRDKKSAGVHDPLFSRALALSNGRDTFVIVSMDLVFIDRDLRREILKRIREKIPIEDRQLLVSATHTHTGAGAYGHQFWQRFVLGKSDKAVFHSLAEKTADAVIRAIAHQTPVKAEYGEISINDLVENRMDPRLEYFPSLKVLRLVDQNGKPAALITAMAAHPTIAPPNDLMFSADFPGVLVNELASANPGSGALFINQAAADLRPHLDGEFKDRFERMARYGQLLADETAKIEFQPVDLENQWTARFETIQLPYVRARAGFLKITSLIGNRIFPQHTFLHAIRMGPLLFVSFPGELAAETGTAIENHIRNSGLIPLIAGFSEDYIGYVIPARYYDDMEQYESTVSFYGKYMDRFIYRKLTAMINALVTPEESEAANPPGELDFADGLPVIKLHGTAYHTGYEEGRLLKREIRQGVHDIFAYFTEEIPVPVVTGLVMNAVLDRAWRKMEPYVSLEEYEQMRGMAKGAGISFKKIKRIHALPEVYPTFCTNGAYWGTATKDGRLIAIRNLDWNRKMGIHRHAVVRYIKRADTHGYANIGYYGFTGVLSGMNEKGISVGQIGATSSDETMEGVPMPFLLKRVLENADGLETAEKIFQNSDRTRGYNYVVSDALHKEAMVVEATQHHVAFFRDDDPKEKNISYAKCIRNAVMRGDPALDPAIRDLQLASKGDPEKPGLEMPEGSAFEIRYLKHAHLVEEHYGKIDPETAKKIALEVAPGSNIQSVIYAFPEFWVANAEEDKRAAESTYHHFDFNDFR